MFNIGGGELIVILLIALIVLGPQRLPDAARQIGKTMGDLRRLSSGFQNEVRSALDTADDPNRVAAGATSWPRRSRRGRPRRRPGPSGAHRAAGGRPGLEPQDGAPDAARPPSAQARAAAKKPATAKSPASAAKRTGRERHTGQEGRQAHREPTAARAHQT